MRVAEQERALAEARQHLEQWDHLVSPPQVGGRSASTCAHPAPAVHLMVSWRHFSCVLCLCGIPVPCCRCTL